jgi:ABC-type lipoprotein export system ATPase subunit
VAYVREREESDAPGDSLGATPRRPPRRSRRQRSAIERAADAIVAYKAPPAGEDPVVEAVGTPHPPLLAVVEAPPPVLEVMAVPQVLEETIPVAVVAPSPPPSPSTFEGFRELLGQPVGLRLDGVTRSFRMGDAKVEAVKDVSLEIAPGEFVAVVGPSGCGKSTLLGLLGGLDRPTSGHVYAAGAALDQLPEPALADYRLQRVGAIFQTFNLLPSMTAEDNVAMPLALAGMPTAARRSRARRLLELVGLGARARFRPGRLSGGEQQRVAVARALAGRPGLVLADEPTGNLDSANGAQVLALLHDLHRRGATVVLVTHDPDVAAGADRVVKMRDGRVVADKTTGRRTTRAPLGLDPLTRLRSVDAIHLGLDAVGRRPLRTALTAAGAALGIALTCLILSLSTSSVGRGVGFLAALTLVVCGFAIVNTMFMSVIDRTREIGVLKALGARFQDITLVFVAEAAVIGATSGLLGAALAGLLASLGNRLAGDHLFVVSPRIGLIAFLLAIGLSLFSGLAPAVRAARLDPMRALRYE